MGRRKEKLDEWFLVYSFAAWCERDILHLFEKLITQRREGAKKS
jgi:hypothetical protein